MCLKTIDIKDLAVYISTVLKDSGIHSVLVGGSCVSIYTSNQYQSYDLDFVSFDRLKDIKNLWGQTPSV